MQFDDSALVRTPIGITLAEQERRGSTWVITTDRLVGAPDPLQLQHETCSRNARRMNGSHGNTCRSSTRWSPTVAAADGVRPRTASDEQDVLAQFNDTARPADLDVRLHTLFERQARSSPDPIAVTNGQEALTYRQLDERADRLACRLEERGVTAGDWVAVPAERSIGVVAALLAPVLKVGAAYVPIHPETPPDRVRLRSSPRPAWPVSSRRQEIGGRPDPPGAPDPCAPVTLPRSPT